MRPFLVVLFALLVAGCYGDGVTSCPPIACPSDKVCDRRGGCAYPEQLTACAERPDGTPCAYPSVPSGECQQELCVPIGCGNGVVTTGEVCDDGNAINGDGCSADCRSTETCGNGIVDPARGEECDGSAQCRDTCKVKLCGDAIVDAPLEQCDTGPANSDTEVDACRTNCQPARCGDGVVDTGEVCDDGNVQSSDGCAADCGSDESCGNGIVDAGEQCDDGDANANAADACRTTCERPRCGDGIVDAVEGCDAGFANGDGPGACRINCQPARCGDTIVDPDEVCDDGNVISGDGCSGDCSSTEVCGDGILNVETGERCDCGVDGLVPAASCNGFANSSNPLAPCRPDCTLRRCGDGVLEPPEQCEGANLGAGSCQLLGYYGGTLACTGFCTYDTGGCTGRCGDGTLDDSEQCEGNEFGGVTCQSYGYYGGFLTCSVGCAIDTSSCQGTCGDAVRNGGEACDTNDFGGASCQTQGFYAGALSCTTGCLLFTGGCSGYCGDEVKNGPEECDRLDFGAATCADKPGLVGTGGLSCDARCKINFDGCAKCNDGACWVERGENCYNCPADCDEATCCGDGVCDGTFENPIKCPADCT